MAKYGRFDPRNKKYGRNKQKSLYKDIRMHDNDKDRKITGYNFTQVIYDDLATIEEDIWDEDEN